MANALSRQPGEVGYPDDPDIGDAGSGLYALQDPIVFSATEDLSKVVAPHLVLANCIEALKSALSSSHPMVALTHKGAVGSTWTMESMPRIGTLHTCILAVATSGMSQH